MKRPVFAVQFLPKPEHAESARTNPRAWRVTCLQDPRIHGVVLQVALNQFALRNRVKHWEDIALRYHVETVC